MENATTFRKDDREAAGSRFASADELHISHDQQRYNCVYSCVSPLGMYSTRNTMMQSMNVLVDSCDMKVNFGALGSFLAEEALECKAPMLSDLQLWTHWNHLPKDGKIIRINHSASVDKFLDALLKGSSVQTAVKLLSLYASYGGKQHVPLSLLKSHAQRAMEVILKSSVDRAAVQSSCDELNGETTVYLPAFMHIKQKEGDPSDNQFNEPVFLASRFVLECLGHLPFENGSSMASASVGAHASEYQSHSRHRHIQCEGLEMIRGKRRLDGRGKEINLRAYCVSTMCGVYVASVRWTSAELR
ncbi:hypothetical protein Syun_014464 [Stephania yunnanensis]|uniref:Uncharacterized protein n=1 Tax=Stephania yunnanensis TaxID=152371 RepID=A0AAP0JJM2_9MAGN